MDPILAEAALSVWSISLPETAVSPALITALRVAQKGDRQRYGLPGSILRSARRARIMLSVPRWPELARNPAFAVHAAVAGDGDPMFFLSHRHYLMRGLTTRQRIDAATTHYRHEIEAFGADYLRAVYRQRALTLWRHEAEGVCYDITLMPGNDVAHEGGLSLVLHADGGRICVLSFSLMPRAVAGFEGVTSVPEALYVVTRKQLTRERAYQTAFNKAFDRSTPAHLCFGAMQGIVLAMGHSVVAGIAGQAQPSHKPDMADAFARSYDDFWASMGGQAMSPRAWLMRAPAELPDLDAMDASQRKRARGRRRHAQAVMEQTRAVIEALRRAPGGAYGSQGAAAKALQTGIRPAP